MGRGGGGSRSAAGGSKTAGGLVYSNTATSKDQLSPIRGEMIDAVQAAGGSYAEAFASQELLQNAIDHGVLPVTVRITTRGDFITVSVTDHGKGFSMRDVKKLAAKSRETTAHGGAGISGMQKIGKITTSRKNGTFTVRFTFRKSSGEGSLEGMFDIDELTNL